MGRQRLCRQWPTEALALGLATALLGTMQVSAGTLPATSPSYPPAVLNAGQQALRLVEQGRFEQALPLWRQLLDWQQQHLGADDPRSLRSLRNLAAVELAAGHATEAAQLYSELRERLVRLQGAATADSMQSALDLARAWRTQTKFEPAAALTHETLALLLKSDTQDPLLRKLTADAMSCWARSPTSKGFTLKQNRPIGRPWPCALCWKAPAASAPPVPGATWPRHCCGKGATQKPWSCSARLWRPIRP